MDIGFIGLGIMGAPMAGHLQSGGHTLHVVKHRSPIPQNLLNGGAIAHNTAAEVAQHADTVFVMVPDTPDVEHVLFGKNWWRKRDGVASGLNAGNTVVDMSSISPIDTKVFADRINKLGCEYLDAPVSGGEIGAKAASLTIMVGGSSETFSRVKPLFELMGKNVNLVGDNGAGQTAKVANQIIVALTVEAIGEALLFASKSGVDPSLVRKALMGGFAGSKIMEIHGERMIKREFKPGFRVKLHSKDLDLALSGARALGIDLPNTTNTQKLFKSCFDNGWAELDHSVLIKALEKLADHEIEPKLTEFGTGKRDSTY